MYLIDTSVWIDFLRGRESQAQTLFATILDQKAPFGMTPVIFQEVLQGAKTKADYEKLDEYLGTQRFYISDDPVNAARHAALIHFKCRKKWHYHPQHH